MNKKKLNYFQWFYEQWTHIIKSSKTCWERHGEIVEDPKVFWFAFICLAVGVGLEAYVQLFLVSITQTALQTDPKLAHDLSVLVKMEPEKFAVFFAEQLSALKKQNVVVLFFLPFIAYFFVHLYAGAIHFMLYLLGFLDKKKQDTYQVTFFVVCFSMAPVLFAFVPIVGSFVVSVWVLLLLVRGLSKFYKITFFQSLMAVLLPAFIIKMMWSVGISALVVAVPENIFDQPLFAMLNSALASIK